jgi:tripeptide aminopeptidase
VHPYTQYSGVDRTSLKLIVRDFETSGLAEKESLVAELAREAVAAHPGARVEIAVDEQYRNMRAVLDEEPDIVEYAHEAVRRSGLSVVTRSIRGGTDGSRLSFMGLPTPNLFAGEHNFHSRLEWVSRQDMEKAVDVVVALCRVWEERAAL